MVKVFSMFTGIGGFEEGIKKVEPVTLVGYSEIEPNSCAILRYHYSEAKNYGDATKIEPETIEDFKVLCAGFPCQTFSSAGKRMGFEDARGTLFFDVARVIQAKRPEILVLENVEGLLNHDEGRTFAVILGTLDELGYDAEFKNTKQKNKVVKKNAINQKTKKKKKLSKKEYQKKIKEAAKIYTEQLGVSKGVAIKKSLGRYGSKYDNEKLEEELGKLPKNNTSKICSVDGDEVIHEVGYLCVMCGNNPVNNADGMCENCEKNFEAQK